MVVTGCALQEHGTIRVFNIDMTGLCSDEQDCISKVVNKAVAWDERASQHSRHLQARYNSMQVTMSLRKKGGRTFATDASKRANSASSFEICSLCGRRGEPNASPTSTGSAETHMCSICSMRWHYSLSSGFWRSSEWRVRTECQGGWGLVLVCGLSSSGGVLRTYVCQVMAGSSAASAGVMMGDEVLSWGHKDVVGRPFKRVSSILHHCKMPSVDMRLRRRSRDGRYTELEVHIVPAHFFGDSYQECHMKTSQILCDPAQLILPNSFSEVELKVGKDHLFPNGRIQLSLTKRPQGTSMSLKMEVMCASYLPVATGMQSALLHVSACIVKSPRKSTEKMTQPSPRSPSPCWYEHLQLEAFHSESDTLKVTVLAKSKIPLLKSTKRLAVVLIKLSEARIDGTSQWYALHSPSSADPANLQWPCDVLLDDIYLQHWRRKIFQLDAMSARGTDSDDENSSLGSHHSLPLAHPKDRNRFRVKALATANKFTDKMRGKHRKEKKPAQVQGALKMAVSAPDLQAAVMSCSTDVAKNWERQQFHLQHQRKATSSQSLVLSDSDTEDTIPDGIRNRRMRRQPQSLGALTLRQESPSPVMKIPVCSVAASPGGAAATAATRRLSARQSSLNSASEGDLLPGDMPPIAMLRRRSVVPRVQHAPRVASRLECDSVSDPDQRPMVEKGDAAKSPARLVATGSTSSTSSAITAKNPVSKTMQKLGQKLTHSVEKCSAAASGLHAARLGRSRSPKSTSDGADTAGGATTVATTSSTDQKTSNLLVVPSSGRGGGSGVVDDRHPLDQLRPRSVSPQPVSLVKGRRQHKKHKRDGSL
eukprot:scpid40289/ scgid1941/ 